MPGHTDANAGVGRGMLWLAAIGVLAGLTWFFAALQDKPGEAVTGSDAAGRAMVQLPQDRSGHYLAEGAINGQAIHFLVDTGATDVAVSEAQARALGLDFGPRVTVMTAAGPAEAWMTRLDRVSIGGISRDNVRATITPALGEEALLGMSFLKHFDIRQTGGTLIIAEKGFET